MTPTDQLRDFRERLDTSLDHHRELLANCVTDLSEEEARRSLVPSRTTLLGLLKHVTYVERFYFDHSVTGRPLRQIGVAATPDRSFVLTSKDTIASVRAAHHEACTDSRATASRLALDDVVGGRVEQPVLTLYLRTLHDLIHHCGHADILREQVLAAR